MQAADGPSTSAVPTLAADPALAAEPPPDDTPMLPAVPLLVPPDFPDNAVTSAFFLFGLQGRCPLYAGCEAHKDTRRTFVV